MRITPRDVAERIYYLVIDSRFHPDEYEQRIMLYLHGLCQLGIAKDLILSKNISTAYYGPSHYFKMIWLPDNISVTFKVGQYYHWPRGIKYSHLKESIFKISYPLDLDYARNHLCLVETISKDKKFGN